MTTIAILAMLFLAGEPLNDCWSTMQRADVQMSSEGGIRVGCPQIDSPIHWVETIWSCDGSDIILTFPDRNVSSLYFELTTDVPDSPFLIVPSARKHVPIRYWPEYKELLRMSRGRDTGCLNATCWFYPNPFNAIAAGDTACMFGYTAPVNQFVGVRASNPALAFAFCVITNTQDHYMSRFLVE